MDIFVSVSEAARIKKVTRQAIYLAIREKKLAAYLRDDKWRILRVDLDEYDKNRYCRLRSVHEGKLIFDESKGNLSISQAAEMIGVDKQKLYYAARTGILKAKRTRCSWVVSMKDLMKYQEKYLKNHFTEKTNIEEKKESFN